MMETQKESDSVFPELNENYKIKVLHNRDPNIDILEFGNSSLTQEDLR